MVVDLMVTTFVGGAVIVTSVPQLSRVTGANVALAVSVGAACGVLCAEHAASASAATAVRRTGRILGIGMRAPGALRCGARGHVARARGWGARRTSGGPPTSGRRDPATAGRVPRTE